MTYRIDNIVKAKYHIIVTVNYQNQTFKMFRRENGFWGLWKDGEKVDWDEYDPDYKLRDLTAVLNPVMFGLKKTAKF